MINRVIRLRSYTQIYIFSATKNLGIMVKEIERREQEAVHQYFPQSTETLLLNPDNFMIWPPDWAPGSAGPNQDIPTRMVALREIIKLLLAWVSLFYKDIPWFKVVTKGMVLVWKLC